MFKVFQVSTQNLERNSKNDVFRVISFAFKFEFVTFKRNLKLENAWNKSYRFRHFEQLSYSKFLEFQLKILSLKWVKPLTSLFLSPLSLSPPFLLPVRARRQRREEEGERERVLWSTILTRFKIKIFNWNSKNFEY